MNETEFKDYMFVFAERANQTSTTELLNLLGRYMNQYHAHGDIESLTLMNDVMLVLLIKEGLIDPMIALQDAKFVLRQREMFETIKQIKS